MSTGSTNNPEAQPLLGSSGPRTYSSEPREVQDPSRAAGGSDEETNVTDDASAPKRKSWSTIVFQGVIVFLALIVLGLFIKGFIDADDVEVWLSPEQCSHWGLLTRGRPSSTWARLSRVLSVVD